MAPTSSTWSNRIRDVRCGEHELRGELEAGNAGGTIKRLVKTLQDTRADTEIGLRRRTVNALAAAVAAGDAKALEAVAAKLKDPDASVRLAAARAVSGLGRSSGKTGVNAAFEALKARNTDVQCIAVQVLAQVATRGDDDVVPEVSDLLQSGEWSVRRAAVEALGFIAGADEVKAAADCLQDEHWLVREKAIATLEALAQVKGGKAEATKLLACQCEELRGCLRMQAVAALANIADHGDRHAMAAVAKRLTDADDHVRRSAVEALARIGKGSRYAAAAAVVRLANDDFRVRRSATDALEQVVEPGDPSVLCVVAAQLENESWASRRSVAAALKKLEVPGGRVAVAAAAQKLDHNDWSVRRKAVQTVQALADPPDNDPVVVKTLTALIDDDDWSVRLAVAEALKQVAGHGDDNAITAACALTADKDEEVRKAALEGLERFAKGKEVFMTIDAVVQCLEDPVEEIRETAVTALAVVAPGARSAIKEVVRKLMHEKEYVRNAAVMAIKGITPQHDKRTIQKLLALSSHEESWVRESVEQALAAISSSQERAAIAAAASFFAGAGGVPDPDDLPSEDEDADSNSESGHSGSQSHAQSMLYSQRS
jgi:HEAT repeat protein